MFQVLHVDADSTVRQGSFPSQQKRNIISWLHFVSAIKQLYKFYWKVKENNGRLGVYVVFGVWFIFAFLRLSPTETAEVLQYTKVEEFDDRSATATVNNRSTER